jgi:predicted dehydrogenase
MPATLNIPVVGSGSIGTRHYNNLLELGVSTELLSFRATGVEGLAAKLQQQPVDGLVIATATPVREAVIRVCAEHNVPMYIEKPLAFTTQQLAEIYRCCSPSLASRSMVGFMMRYHPLLLRAAKLNLNNIYRFEFVIGHDVTQWRKNWRFADSYAANPDGGGVLLDLCHELDMAKVLFPSAETVSVLSTGHTDFPKVDFATTVAMASSNGMQGQVTMDYLSPVSTRKLTLYGLEQVVQIDFGALSFLQLTGESPATHAAECIEFDRNDMFIDAMQDFIALIGGEQGGPHCPRLDTVRNNSETIARAWQQRRFTGTMSHRIT